ncbi:AAA family ATPase [Sulfurospirillum cavolei]|uniref:AAA family ATPase n=1 Tax=Sulfurospirillum cavolei TaxID=366522 RepID=UPI0005AB522E|nr:AAA family ATPase [Sulfurospirillum cavolei]
MKESFIETSNYTKIAEAFTRLKDLPVTSPKMGLGYGLFGLGKTFGLEKITVKYNAVLLRALHTWRPKSMLERLCEEMGLDRSGTSAQLYVRLIEEIRTSTQKRPIIIDEVDALLSAKNFEMLEILRDIHDETGVIIFFVGMEESNAKMKRHRHFYSRIFEFVKFKPVVFEDVEKYCKTYSDKVEIADDLIAYFATTYPNLRQLRKLLTDLENVAKRQGISACDLEQFKALEIEKIGRTDE